ncbi:hypothetical protein F2Q69_00044592 [Brassica cretica]|uniref:Uncharacterized protein n=1 Tax=Brassica cretica TaxID=69181 RepID=A0A8S9NPJ3_BRACR|nr:hypothetical protein F2Q69_00044592 [Brassica cretica]
MFNLESSMVLGLFMSIKIELSDHEKEEDEIERLVFGTEFGEVERFVVATAEAQIVKDAARKVEATNLQRAEHKAEKQVEKRADNKLKEVKLEEATKVELSPYDKLPFPQRVLTKSQKKVLSKFRKDLSDVGVRLPEISESSKELCDEHLESAKKEEVSRATKAAHDEKKIVKEPHPPPLDKTPHTLTPK